MAKNILKLRNKSRKDLAKQIADQNKVNRIKETVRRAFPSIQNLDTVYDAQTAVNALSGYIEAEVEKKISEIKLSDLNIDLSSEQESNIKTAILDIVDLFKNESAQEIAETMERLGTVLQTYVADLGMKEKMSFTVNDIVSK